MPKIDVYDVNGKKTSSLELDEAIFGTPVKEYLLWSVVRYQMAARRQGTAKVKTRSEVSGGGKKPWRQKGTGRARVGTIRSPLWRGGGVVFGPAPRSYAFKLNKKVRKAALCSALSKRVLDNALVVIDAFGFEAIKTRQVTDFMKRFEIEDMLVVLPQDDEKVQLSARNLKNVTVLPSEGLNVYDVLHRSHLVLTKDAVEAVTRRLAR
jgi:large subunit ribosomal protein L4